METPYEDSIVHDPVWSCKHRDRKCMLPVEVFYDICVSKVPSLWKQSILGQKGALLTYSSLPICTVWDRTD